MTEENNPVAEAIRDAFGCDALNIQDAIKDTFRRDNEDDNACFTTIVDVIEMVAENTKRISDAITPGNASPAPCPSGDGMVGSLTEAVMGLTRAMTQIAGAIERVADAIESH